MPVFDGINDEKEPEDKEPARSLESARNESADGQSSKKVSITRSGAIIREENEHSLS